jgi:mycothiol synthase
VELQIRLLEDGDYERLAEIDEAIDSRTAKSAQTLRRRNVPIEARIRLVHLVADCAGEGIVGSGRLTHIWWAYHPRRYQLRISVQPTRQRQGVGSALFDRLLSQLHDWDAELVRTEAPADRDVAVSFLEHRGFREWRRRWSPVLDVASANLSPLRDAEERITRAGIHITTYAAEHARRGQRLARDVYETDTLISSDEPATERDGEPMSFERFSATQLDAPEALPDGHFLALDDDRLVGVSRVLADLKHPDVLHQDLTGVLSAYRGRGIAQALKLRTIQFARERGYRAIRTSNDSTNAPMLHINDLIGFKRESPIIIFERRLDT